MQKTLPRTGFVCALFLLLVASTAVQAEQFEKVDLPDTVVNSSEEYTIPTVVKVAGINWFSRMKEGVQAFEEMTGINTYQLGPAKADTALQAQIIQDLIAKQPDAITVVPFSPPALEPILRRAMEKGIVVVTHEASGIQNAVYDIEAFNNGAYGAHLMDALAKCMEYDGKYAVFVGSLTSKSHNQWVDAAIARQKEAYPKMELVGSKNVTHDNAQEAYAATQQLLRAYPDIEGFQGSASTDVAGIGLAIQQRGLEEKTCVVGTSIPSVAGEYIKTGAVDLISFWDPALAGMAMLTVSTLVLEGEKIEDGDDLGIPGYHDVSVKGKVIRGSAWVDVTKENLNKYNF